MESKTKKTGKSNIKRMEPELFSSMDKQDSTEIEETKTSSVEKVEENASSASNLRETSPTEGFSNEEIVSKADILSDPSLVVFIKNLDYLNDYQKQHILYAAEKVVKMHSPGGQQSHETSPEQIISHLKSYCLAKSRDTGDYFCLRRDNVNDVEAVNRVCEDLNNHYADR